MILGDGTSVADVLAQNKELSADVAELKRRLREIANLCRAPNFTAAARRNAILEITSKKL